MTQGKKAGDEGAGLLTWVQGLAPAIFCLRAAVVWPRTRRLIPENVIDREAVRAV